MILSFEQSPHDVEWPHATLYEGTGINPTCCMLCTPGNDYLAEICREWEAAAQKVPAGVRTVIVRTGLVLAREGGVIAKMLPIFELFAGG